MYNKIYKNRGFFMICKVACCDDDRKQLEHIKKYFETLSIQPDLEFDYDIVLEIN